jgi:hypothetical protein
MARIRSIKPEFWVSEQIAECSPNARLTFVGMWTFSDDNGVHPAKPKTLKAELYPMDDVTSNSVAGWVNELINVGLVIPFEHAGTSYWHITGWGKHQKIDRPSYKYPTPPESSNSPTPQQPLDEDSSNARRAPPPGVDRIGKDRKGVEIQRMFAEVWSAYPKKSAKPAAEKAFKAAKVDEHTLGTILADIESRKACDDWKKENGKYVPNPATYLNQRRWEDVVQRQTDSEVPCV